MNLQHAPVATAEDASQRQPARAELRGFWLALVRVLWVALVAFILGCVVASIPPFAAMLASGCSSAACHALIAPNTVAYFKASGISVQFYLIYYNGLFIVFLLAYLTIGTVIFWRRSRDRMALLTSFALVGFTISFNGNVPLELAPALQIPIQIVSFLGNICFGIFLFIFPNGRFVPHWTRWLVVLLVFYWGVTDFFPNSPLATFWLTNNLFPLLLVISMAVQIYRYRKVYNRVERQQTKWVVYGICVGLLGALLVIGFYFIHPLGIFHPNALSDLFAGTMLYVFILLIPLSIGFAILRSRLWEIDTIINKTLVYGLLTVLLAGIFAGLVLGLQALLGGLLHQTSAIALVVSTLAIYALFNPLRRRIQAIIDRRFYRRKYDAAKTLAAFSNALRHEVDLNRLSEHLLSVVEETMQPTHVTLWLRKRDQE
jgi:hypothetical protein